MALHSQTQRTFLIGFITSIALCGLIGIFCLATGAQGQLMERVLVTTLTVAGCSLLGLICAIPMEKKRWHPLGPVGLVAVTVAFLLTLAIIWIDMAWRETEGLITYTGIAWTLAVAIPHVGLISLARLRKQFEWVRWCTVLTIAMLASQIIITIIVEDGSDLWFRAMGILCIFVACGSITVPILHRLSVIRKRESIRTTELAISLTCPRCQQTQTLPAGRSSCKQCRLNFHIDIEEEHCGACGYPLYQLKSVACPECGTPIAHVSQTA